MCFGGPGRYLVCNKTGQRDFPKNDKFPVPVPSTRLAGHRSFFPLFWIANNLSTNRLQLLPIGERAPRPYSIRGSLVRTIDTTRQINWKQTVVWATFINVADCCLELRLKNETPICVGPAGYGPCQSREIDRAILNMIALRPAHSRGFDGRSGDPCEMVQCRTKQSYKQGKRRDFLYLRAQSSSLSLSSSALFLLLTLPTVQGREGGWVSISSEGTSICFAHARFIE